MKILKGLKKFVEILLKHMETYYSNSIKMKESYKIISHQYVQKVLKPLYLSSGNFLIAFICLPSGGLDTSKILFPYMNDFISNENTYQTLGVKLIKKLTISYINLIILICFFLFLTFETELTT